MNATQSLAGAALWLLLSTSAAAQTASNQPLRPLESGRAEATEGLPTARQIAHEDELNRVQEQRLGGQTQRIEVQPKGGGAPYQVAPLQLDQGSGGTATNAQGRSSWRVLSF